MGVIIYLRFFWKIMVSKIMSSCPLRTFVFFISQLSKFGSEIMVMVPTRLRWQLRGVRKIAGDKWAKLETWRRKEKRKRPRRSINLEQILK